MGDEVATFILNSTSSKYNIGYINKPFNLDFQNIGDIKVLLEDFMLEYEKYLAYYREKFGDITVRYGIVYYEY